MIWYDDNISNYNINNINVINKKINNSIKKKEKIVLDNNLIKIQGLKVKM